MRVSFGKVNITPKDYIGRCLAGYTPVPRCTGKYDDIHARAVLIEDLVLGNVQKRLLLIALDFVQVPIMFTDYIKEKIQDAYKIHPNQVLIHAIHTHKSLDMSGLFIKGDGYPGVIWSVMFGSFRGDDKYKVWIARRIVDMVGEMIRQLQPARIAWSKQTIEDDIIINRRQPTRRSKSRLGVIAFKKLATDDIIGFIANYGMHPTTLNMAIDKLSADYPGRLIATVEKESGGSIDCVFFTGPAGDLNPITTCGTDFDALERDKTPMYQQHGTYKDTKRLGSFLGRKALELARGIPDDNYFDTIEFKSHVKVFWVPMRDFTRYWSKSWFYNRLVHGIKRHILLPVALVLADANEPNFAGFAAKHRGWKEIVTYTQVQYIKVTTKAGDKQGSLAITGVPGELFEHFANQIFDRTLEGPEDTFIFQTSNDWIAYLFPLTEYMNGGYEPFASYSPICGTYVKKKYFKLLQEIEEDITGGYF
ncbi:MAG TPA: hypothetical protein VKM55_09605 [Candidatus Lokiarchaeia archaeon]|nr:hypothetical protein [Candidatus Lokiarchaeia archaeon]